MIYEELLNLLKRNKRFPHYAAERRIDIFINFFLEDILTVYYNKKVIFIAPEFPLRIDNSSYRTVKLDYLCAFEDSKQPIFVELKTDALYSPIAQACRYVEHAKSWPSCINNLQSIKDKPKRRSSSFTDKYEYLFSCLSEAGLIGPITSSKNIHVHWRGKAIILYLGSIEDSFIYKVYKACNWKLDRLLFNDIAELLVDSHIPYYKELIMLLDSF